MTDADRVLPHRSSYTELGCAIPLSGGAQAYLAYSVGPKAAVSSTLADYPA